jgi:hypothetical protein
VFGAVILIAIEEVPPPGEGFVSARVAVPASDISVEAIATDNWVEVTNVTGRTAPFKLAVVCATNPLPVTESAKAGLPAARDAGFMLVIDGAGYGLTGVELPPPPQLAKNKTAATWTAKILICQFITRLFLNRHEFTDAGPK